MSIGLGNQRFSQKEVRGQEHVNFILYGLKGLATRRTPTKYKKTCIIYFKPRLRFRDTPTRAHISTPTQGKNDTPES